MLSALRTALIRPTLSLCRTGSESSLISLVLLIAILLATELPDAVLDEMARLLGIAETSSAEEPEAEDELSSSSLFLAHPKIKVIANNTI